MEPQIVTAFLLGVLVCYVLHMKPAREWIALLKYRFNNSSQQKAFVTEQIQERLMLASNIAIKDLLYKKGDVEKLYSPLLDSVIEHIGAEAAKYYKCCTRVTVTLSGCEDYINCLFWFETQNERFKWESPKYICYGNEIITMYRELMSPDRGGLVNIYDKYILPVVPE